MGVFIPRMITEDLTWLDFEQIQGQGSVKISSSNLMLKPDTGMGIDGQREARCLHQGKMLFSH